MDDGAWFAAKRFGIGIGLPIRWQGWLSVALVVVAVVIADRLLMPGHRLAFAATIVVVTAAFSGVAIPRTRGGWHWRWGGAE